jgi:putative spermidine/putrescine transport system permease protein
MSSEIVVPAQQAEARKKRRSSSAVVALDTIALLLVMLYLLIPLAATLIFGLSGPNGLDLSIYSSVLSDADLSKTLFFSLGLALTAMVLAIVLVTPTAYWVQLRIPQARPLLDFLSLIPFAVPAILMSLGLLEVYNSPNLLVSILSFGLVPLLSSPPVVLANSPQLLVCAYVIISLPFVYRPIENSLQAINARVLTEAASSLGSSWWRTFLTVILPNIWPGVISAALLTFSTAMGEFTLAQLFGIYTFPIYLNQTGQSDAHKAALLTILSFAFTLACVLGIIFLARRQPGGQRADVEIAAAK